MSRCTESTRIYRSCLGGVVGVALAGCAHLGAPGPLVADRPGYTDTPVVLPAGGVQLEAGVTDDRTGPAGARTTYLSTGETLLRVGAGANAEVRLYGNSYGVRTTSGGPTVRGVEDARLGGKLSLVALPDSVHSLLPNLSLLAATTLPTGAAGIGAGEAQPEVKLAASWTTASPLSFYSNVAYGSIYNETGRAERTWASLASWWAVNPRVSLFAEGMAIGRVSGSGSGTAGDDVDGGVTYLVGDRLQLDLRVGRGLGGESSTERFIGAGFARRW
jgi:hypothetical protein